RAGLAGGGDRPVRRSGGFGQGARRQCRRRGLEGGAGHGPRRRGAERQRDRRRDQGQQSRDLCKQPVKGGSMSDRATSQSGDSMIWNFKQLAHNSLEGFGGMGEGMSMQLAKDGRRILWMAHESAPKNFTAVDVTDPRNLKIVARADLPQSHMRSNSLETVGDVMAIAYQTKDPGLQPAGFELLDISTPENPRRISFVDLSGPTSRGVHQLWFADGEYIHLSAGSPDSKPTHPKDDQFY